MKRYSLFLLALFIPVTFVVGGKVAKKSAIGRGKARIIRGERRDVLVDTIPIVFHEKYDISFLGIERLHPFDSKKYGKVAKYIRERFDVNLSKPAGEVSSTDLMTVHAQKYLNSLKYSSNVADILQIAPLAFVPNFLLQKSVLRSMRYATAGTVLAGELALKFGWSINLSGGYHHAKSDEGEGFCVYGDIPLMIKKLRKNNPNLKVLVVDLDAHQGNGLEAMLGQDEKVYIFDMYSKYNYPADMAVKKYIDFNYPQENHVDDQVYLTCLKRNLPNAIEQCNPDLIVYNAGTDIFELDPLGQMAVTQDAITERDAFVFGEAIKNEIPITMTLSGGYTKESARIISLSIGNLIEKYQLIDVPPRIRIRK